MQTIIQAMILIYKTRLRKQEAKLNTTGLCKASVTRAGVLSSKATLKQVLSQEPDMLKSSGTNDPTTKKRNANGLARYLAYVL